MIHTQILGVAFAMSFLVVACVTPLVRKIAIKIDFFDFPNSQHKTHAEPIPYLGGISIICGVVITALTIVSLNPVLRSYSWVIASIIGSSLFLGIVGLIDDWKSLQPFPRLVSQTLIGIFTAILLVKSNHVGNPTGNSYMDGVITVIWIVIICNSINFLDNIDGGASGTLAISTAGLASISFFTGQVVISFLSVTLCACTLSFLIWNKSPARIYLGDAGALFLGCMISVLTVRLEPTVDARWISFSIPILLLSLPLMDTCVVIISRIRRGVSIFQGGRDHLSHRLMRIGISKKMSVLLLWGIQFFFSSFAVIVSKLDSLAYWTLVLPTTVWIFLFYKLLIVDDMKRTLK